MAARKSYFNLKESWPMVLLIGAVALGALVWWNQRNRTAEDWFSLNSPQTETVSLNEFLQPNSEPQAEVPAPAIPSKPLTIQVHSFNDETKAQKSLEELRKYGFSGVIVKRDLKEKGIWYRVCVGEFETRQQADEQLAKLREKYRYSFVINR